MQFSTVHMSLIVLFHFFFFCSAFILPSPGFNSWDQGLSLILRHELSSNGSRVTCAYNNWDPFKLITPLLLKKNFFFFFPARARYKVLAPWSACYWLLVVCWPGIHFWACESWASTVVGKSRWSVFGTAPRPVYIRQLPSVKEKKKKKKNKSSMKWLCSVGRFKALQGKRKKNIRAKVIV